LNDKDYLELISVNYPTIRSVITELINLNAILNLPKGTEHFVSDIHGEYEAFQHIMNNCSGVIREKVELLFGDRLSDEEKSELCTLIYYPARKLDLLKSAGLTDDKWFLDTLNKLIELCRLLASKYTRSKVRKALPKEYSYIIDELLHAADGEDANRKSYHGKILDSIVNTKSAEDFVVELTKLIKILAVDRIHVVGDIYDRGPNPDKIMNMLAARRSVDIQWGNHDVLWMGAAAGSKVCIAAAVRNSVAAGNYSFLESGYGVSLRPLALFAEKAYPHEADLKGALIKAISIILFKLEAQTIRRNPDFGMSDRLMLEQINYENFTIDLNGRRFVLDKRDFATVNPSAPEELTADEENVTGHLRNSFLNSGLLHKHVDFLYQNGSMYKLCNYNLLYHGCVPLNADGSFASLKLNGRFLSGKALFDEFGLIAGKAYSGRGSDQAQYYLDCMWYLWCGRLSPLYGRSRMTTFERMFIQDKSAHAEDKNAYYRLCDSEEICFKILREFGLYSEYSRIINGHVPVRVSEGESPLRANGRLFFIDGGFCKAYQKTTGIAGYTLIYNSQGMRLMSHSPFQGIEPAIQSNGDIVSHCDLIEAGVKRVTVLDTDAGTEISNKIFMLTKLLEAYRRGWLAYKED
jgi:fructose-1,6-bisphosphatase-3